MYLENGFHTSQLFQSSSTAAAMEFMVKAFNVNTSLQSGDQIYQWRMIGSTIGFIGMFMFAVFFALWLSQMPLFRGTSRGNAIMRVAESHPGTKAWAWGCLIVNTLFATVSTLFLYYNGVDTPYRHVLSGRGRHCLQAPCWRFPPCSPPLSPTSGTAASLRRMV